MWDFSYHICIMAQTCQPPTPITEKQVKKIAKEVVTKGLDAAVTKGLEAKAMQDYFYSLLTGNTVQNHVHQLCTNYLSGVDSKARHAASDEVKSRVPGEVSLCVGKYAKEQVPPLVKSAVTEKLATLSGVNDVLNEHKETVRTMEAEHGSQVQTLLANQRDTLSKIAENQMYTFARDADKHSRTLVDNLVSSNGQVIQGFQDRLGRQNADNFANLSGQLTSRMVSLERENNDLHTKNTLLTAWMVVVTAGLVGLAYYVSQ